MSTKTLVLASGNAGKAKEINEILNSPLAAALPPLALKLQSEWNIPEAEETGLTFLENALIKARHAAELTGCAAISDDSGLAVDALKGAPGIYSARYAGEDVPDHSHVDKLLENLKDVPEAERGASFHCVMVYLRHPADPTPLFGFGHWRGCILHAPQGHHGFGYDPVFWVEAEHCSSAELTPNIKHQYSHRGQALQQLITALIKEHS